MAGCLTTLTEKPLEGGRGVAVSTETLDRGLVPRLDCDVVSGKHCSTAVLYPRPLRRHCNTIQIFKLMSKIIPLF